MLNTLRVLVAAAIILLSAPVWGNSPPPPIKPRPEPTPPSSRPASDMVMNHAPQKSAKLMSLGVGLGASMLLMGGGLYLVRRQRPH